MALSYYSNWGTLEQYLNSEMNILSQTQPELSTELIGFYDNSAISEICIDPLFDLDPNEEVLMVSDDYTHLLPYLSPPPSDHLKYSLSPELCPAQEFETCCYPKRQKSCHCQDSCYYWPAGFCNHQEFVPNPSLQLPEFLPLPDFQTPVAYNCTSHVVESSVKKPNGESLSAQSVAARQRRRKITEKTQELGKLIPGGHKMNTADMFQAAFNYINYLQAQLGILQLMASILKNEEAFHLQELHFLVGSPLIQEKLYSEDKCLVPKQFVQTLADDPELQSNPMIFRDINQLIRTAAYME
ncbi:hypothetical protein F0562_017964 [Nyssa sinensis]|uniref:BHLH domain-containing protein n=1 Tax=Nyssa sinensis TaxID=561372 RepID=A0A5J4Z867_9ASTE|nr:hypothetical protein F0562_017964 [Nyssa sinensis]